MKKVLVLNSGSATLKFKLFSAIELKPEVSGIIERIGLKKSFIRVDFPGKSKESLQLDFSAGLKNHRQAFSVLLKSLPEIFSSVEIVGHRIVHGGDDFYRPTILNSFSIKKIEKYNHLAPLHNPVNLAVARSALKLMPRAKHYGVFDTFYYVNLPDRAKRYALPDKFFNLGIKKYGFHGISHAYAAMVGSQKANLPIAKSKVVTCHLGSGCSITATQNGNPVDTTMGFTPLDGLMMSTRPGSIDPGAVLFMVSDLKMKAKEISEVLNRQSGFLAVAGTMDMREILSAAGKKVVGYKVNKKFSRKDKVRSKLALDMFIYSIVKYIGQFAVVMGGLDLLVFTGGVGERSPAVRKMVLAELKLLPKFKSIVVSADEELMIAKKILNK